MLLAGSASETTAFVTMLQSAAKVLSFASATSVSRGIAAGIRHYCKNTPTKLRVSQALSGAELGSNIKVQVSSVYWLVFSGNCAYLCDQTCRRNFSSFAAKLTTMVACYM